MIASIISSDISFCPLVLMVYVSKCSIVLSMLCPCYSFVHPHLVIFMPFIILDGKFVRSGDYFCARQVSVVSHWAHISLFFNHTGEEIKLEDLSDDEIKRFRQALASGELSKMIEPWTPWWKKPSARSISLGPDGSQLIRQVSVEDTATSDPMTDQEPSINEIPEGPEWPLPSLKQLTRVEPSPLLAVHLVDILYSYCFTLRLYNGDWHSDPLGASTVALSMSKVMGEDAKPETVPEALTACIEETCSPAYRHTGGFRFAIGLVDDIISILSLGHNALVCALSDFHRLIEAGKSMLKADRVGKTANAQSSSKLRGAARKLFFMTCWVNEQPDEAWPPLARIVEVQKASLEELDSGNLRVERMSKQQSKVVIEEL